jgi:hypothetical protein
MSTQGYTLRFIPQGYLLRGVLQAPAHASLRAPDRSWAEILVEDTQARVVARHMFPLSGSLPEQIGPFMVDGELADARAHYSLRACVRFHQGEGLEPGDLCSRAGYPISAGANTFKLPLSVVGASS